MTPAIKNATRRWRIAHPEKYAVQKFRYHLKRNYGITITQYDELLLAQGGLCAICKGLPEYRRGKTTRLDVDHNHVTGQVRGLLCSTCNTALHKVERDASWAKAAQEYLTKEKINCLQN